LSAVAELVNGSQLAFGAQNVSAYANGAYTGEVSAAMLWELGCAYAIVGHSERRHQCGETDAVVAAKACAALDAGITPIVCIGETEQEREGKRTNEVLGRQLSALIDRVPASDLVRCVLAYEPVWAIGTGRTATLEQVWEAHTFIRYRLSDVDPALAEMMTVLYGGSVKPANATELFALPEVDGGLIGGASLAGEDFLKIYAAMPAARPL
jgi:triosephosphate isomerase